MAEDGEAVTLHHISESLGNGLCECSQMRKRRGGIFVSFIRMYGLAVLAYETLVTENAKFAPCRVDHLASQHPEALQLTRLDRQLDVPRNLTVHTQPPVRVREQTGTAFEGLIAENERLLSNRGRNCNGG
jgi:hypothetical protein